MKFGVQEKCQVELLFAGQTVVGKVYEQFICIMVLLSLLKRMKQIIWRKNEIFKN